MEGCSLNTDDFELDYTQQNESFEEYDQEEKIVAPPISRAEVEERIRAQIMSRLCFTCDHCEYATSIGIWLLKDLCLDHLMLQYSRDVTQVSCTHCKV